MRVNILLGLELDLVLPESSQPIAKLLSSFDSLRPIIIALLPAPFRGLRGLPHPIDSTFAKGGITKSRVLPNIQTRRIR